YRRLRPESCNRSRHIQGSGATVGRLPLCGGRRTCGDSERLARKRRVRGTRGSRSNAMKVMVILLGLAVPLLADSVSEGRDIFNRSCTACHGLDGVAGDRGPALGARRRYMRRTDEQIFDAIQNGIPGTLMPASSMPEADIRKVVAYLRSLRSPASQAPV